MEYTCNLSDFPFSVYYCDRMEIVMGFPDKTRAALSVENRTKKVFHARIINT